MTSNSMLLMPNGEFQREPINTLPTPYLLTWLSREDFRRNFPQAIRTIVPVLALRLRDVDSACRDLAVTTSQPEQCSIERVDFRDLL
jgi:hypothetical protein